MLHREMLLIMVEVVTTECFFSSWRQTKNNSVCHIWICYKPGIFYSALRLRRYNKLSLFTFQRILVLYIDSNSTTDVKIKLTIVQHDYTYWRIFWYPERHIKSKYAMFKSRGNLSSHNKSQRRNVNLKIILNSCVVQT